MKKGTLDCLTDEELGWISVKRKAYHSVASETEKWPACTAAWICCSVKPISPRTRNNSPIVFKQSVIKC